MNHKKELPWSLWVNPQHSSPNLKPYKPLTLPFGRTRYGNPSETPKRLSPCAVAQVPMNPVVPPLPREA